MITKNFFISLNEHDIFAQVDDNEIFKNEIKINGSNIDLMVMINPAMLHNPTDRKSIVLSFIPKSNELTGSSLTPEQIDHLDFNINISKDGKEIFNKQFHDHDGNLMVEFIPILGNQTSEVGGSEDPDKTHTTLYMMERPIFVEEGTYTILSEIVGVEFNPIANTISDTFDIQISNNSSSDNISNNSK
jgi:hypothetical protein